MAFLNATTVRRARPRARRYEVTCPRCGASRCACPQRQEGLPRPAGSLRRRRPYQDRLGLVDDPRRTALRIVLLGLAPRKERSPPRRRGTPLKLLPVVPEDTRCRANATSIDRHLPCPHRAAPPGRPRSPPGPLRSPLNRARRSDSRRDRRYGRRTRGDQSWRRDALEMWRCSTATREQPASWVTRALRPRASIDSAGAAVHGSAGPCVGRSRAASSCDALDLSSRA